MSRYLLIFIAVLICTSVCADGVTAATTTTAATTAKATTAGPTTAAATTAKAATTVAGTTTAKAATTGAAGSTTAKATPTKSAITTGKPQANTTATAKISTTAKTTPTTTEFKPFPEIQCHMPFWRAGVWHHTCIKYDAFGDFWCSLTANFTKDENWKRCRSPDLKRFQCHIPFEFDGKNHTSCLPVKKDSSLGRGAHHSFWCATVPKINNFSPHGTDWAYCEDEHATGLAYLKAVGPRKNIAAAKVNATGKGGNGTAESAAAAAAAGAPGKALNGGAGGQGGSGASAAGLSASATIGIAVGVVCSVLAVVAVIAGIAIRKRRRSGQHRALLQTREKGTYGGMEASD